MDQHRTDVTLSPLVDLGSLLALLPHAGVVGTLKGASQDQDPRWIDAALDRGLLDKPTNKHSLPSEHDELVRWAQRCKAAMHVMAQEQQVGTTGGAAPGSHFALHDDMSATMERVVQTVARALSTPELDHNFYRIKAEVGSQAMGLAALMDRPDLLQQLTSKGSVADFFNLPELSDKYLEQPNPEFRMSPLLCAIQHNKKQAIDELLSQQGLLENLCCDGTAVLGLELAMSQVKLTCSNDTMTNILEQTTHPRSYLDEISKDQDNGSRMVVYLAETAAQAGIKLMSSAAAESGEVLRSNKRLLESFILADVFHALPVKALCSGLQHGLTNVVQSFEPHMPWGDLKPNTDAATKGNQPIADALKLAIASDHADAIRAFFDIAKRQGHFNEGIGPVFLEMDPDSGERYLGKEATEACLRPHWQFFLNDLLTHGLNVNARGTDVHGQRHPLQDLSDMVGSKASLTLRSKRAHSSVQQLLDTFPNSSLSATVFQ